MISRLLSAASRTTLATCLLATTLSVTGPALAADKPDLHMEVDTSAFSVFVGDTVTLTYTVTNMGPLDVSSALMSGSITGAQSVRIVQQPVGQPLCALNAFALTCEGLHLAPGDSTTVTLSATASTTTAGEITATGTIDPNNKIDESNEANNAAAREIWVYKRPDYTATVRFGPNLVEPGDRVWFNVLVRNLGGDFSELLNLDFRTNGGLEYDSVTIVGPTQGFTCAVHNPPLLLGPSYVSCSGGTLGDPTADPTNDDSVNVFMSARVLPRGAGPIGRTFTAKVNGTGPVGESNYTNNSDTWNFQYAY